jgi:hypothetical protein
MPNPLYGSGQEMAQNDETPRWDSDPATWSQLPRATRLGYVDAWRTSH